MINVAIVEDNEEYRERIVHTLNKERGFACVGEYGTAEEAIEKLITTKATVVLMDIHLPGMSGVECVHKLKEQNVELQIMMLTMFENDENVFHSLTAGATGYMVKRTKPVDIISAIKELLQGGSPMSSEIARKVVTAFQQIHTTTIETESLSVREKEILSYLAKGYRYKEIGVELFISVDTVRTHIQHIYKKLQVNSRAQAVNKVLR